MNKTFDYIIIGQGLAGLAAAYFASRNGKVALVSKNDLKISNSYTAQGGVAAAVSPHDSVKKHYDDTIRAGKGLCNEKAVKILVTEGKKIIEEIIALGMNFDRSCRDINVSLEGGHSTGRVLHANGAATGKELVKFFANIVMQNKNVHIFKLSSLHSLIADKKRIHGAAIIDIKTKNVQPLKSSRVIIASGGLAGLFQRTTNPKSTEGGGIIAAYNAGAEIENLEFIQFHPTALNIPGKPAFLLSEALRGDGALLADKSGHQIFKNSPVTELSPRDEVTKGIYNYFQTRNKKTVYLNLSRIAPDLLNKKYFPILNELKRNGLQLSKKLIPVSPAAHYTIGGIKTGLNGETSIKGLYAIGEAASTGVHGANRLASNSLLECLVFAKRSVKHSSKLSVSSGAIFNYKKYQLSSTEHGKKKYLFVRNKIEKLLWNKAGILRNKKSLELFLNYLNFLSYKYPPDVNDFYSRKTTDVIQLAILIAEGALKREESRGCHWRSDFPKTKISFKKNIIQRRVN